MNLFFELSAAIGSGHKHFAAYHKIKPMYGLFPSKYHSLAASSDRIWLEDDGEVKFVKHRWLSSSTAQVDLEEFMMVKLKSKPV